VPRTTGGWLTFSVDDGHSWIGHLQFYAGATTSYGSVVEIAPDTVVVAWNRVGIGADGNPENNLVATTFSVKRAQSNFRAAHSQPSPPIHLVQNRRLSPPGCSSAGPPAGET
jgi:hypothetical protein